MILALRLLIPALIPSWNFFDVIASSPRIEYARSAENGQIVRGWREFCPRPERISLSGMVARLFWNARWNELLFMVSCAERVLAEPTPHSQDEIFRRIAAHLAKDEGAGGWLSFRILLVDANEGPITRTVAFVADSRCIADIPVR